MDQEPTREEDLQHQYVQIPDYIKVSESPPTNDSLPWWQCTSRCLQNRKWRPVSHAGRALEVGRSSCRLARWSGSNPLPLLPAAPFTSVTRVIYQGVSCAGSPAWLHGLSWRHQLCQARVFCVNPGLEHRELRQRVRPAPGLPRG